MADGDHRDAQKTHATNTTSGAETKTLDTYTPPASTTGFFRIFAIVQAFKEDDGAKNFVVFLLAGGRVVAGNATIAGCTAFGTVDPGTAGYSATIDDDGAGVARVRITSGSGSVRWVSDTEVSYTLEAFTPS